MPLVNLIIKVNDKEYTIQRKIESDDPAVYRIRVLDDNHIEQFVILIQCPYPNSFIENDNYVKRIVEELVRSNDEEQVS